MKRHCLSGIMAGLICLTISLILLKFATAFPEAANWYTLSVYPVLVSAVGRLTGLLPFSVAEILLYILIICLIISVISMTVKVYNCIRIRRAGHSSAQPYAAAFRIGIRGIIISWLSGIILPAGILMLLYTLGCGINYHSRTFSETEGITVCNYTSAELEEVCGWLTAHIIELEYMVARDADGTMVTGDDREGAAVKAMEDLSSAYMSLKGYYPGPKELIVSEILSWQSLSGVYSPFTIEANYNGDMTGYNIPFTMCHELSHLRGFMEEKEANFIAFLACINSEETEFRYSGYLSGWVYCMNALYKADRESWSTLYARLPGAAAVDILANNAFWDRYDGRAAEAAKQVNDTYLKASGQADGIKGYDRMVDLIVAYYNILVQDN